MAVGKSETKVGNTNATLDTVFSRSYCTSCSMCPIRQQQIRLTDTITWGLFPGLVGGTSTVAGQQRPTDAWKETLDDLITDMRTTTTQLLLQQQLFLLPFYIY